MKKNIGEELKNNKGITLVALVVTIIVLLILAAVSLSAIFRQDGIFNKAEQAADKYSQAKARETLELALSEAQMRKYESGLTESELDEEISKVGSLLPKEDENSNYQLVIVEGHIFEIDRSVPKIVDYKGPADGIIITAKITQNGDWSNPKATVTGTITKYGGGAVVSSTATATEGVTITGFPTTGGSYTIPNIEKDTDITITASADDGRPAVTKIIKIRLVRDNTPPVISDAKAEATLMKIKISAKAVDSESGVQSLTYKIEPNTIKDGKAEGTLISGTPIEIEATAVGNYTVTFTATNGAGNTATTEKIRVTTTDAMSVEDAKRLVTSMEALQEYIGTKVDYKDGETWQIFYYDEEEKNSDGTGKGVGYFGEKNTVYLKRAYGEVTAAGLTASTKTDNTDPAVAMMRQMNPQWRDSNYSEVDGDNEKGCVTLCDPSIWNSQRNTIYSSYAIGSPSLEMYMKAFNVYKTGNKNANNLVCKIKDQYGYTVGTNGNYTFISTTDSHSIEPGPNSIFMEDDRWWCLASPSTGSIDFSYVYKVNGFNERIESSLGWNIDVCPIVPLDL